MIEFKNWIFEDRGIGDIGIDIYTPISVCPSLQLNRICNSISNFDWSSFLYRNEVLIDDGINLTSDEDCIISYSGSGIFRVKFPLFAEAKNITERISEEVVGIVAMLLSADFRIRILYNLDQAINTDAPYMSDKHLKNVDDALGSAVLWIANFGYEPEPALLRRLFRNAPNFEAYEFAISQMALEGELGQGRGMKMYDWL